MVTPERMLRLIIEIIFVLLGGLVAWLGWTGHIFFDRRKIRWEVLSPALILWGLRGLYKPNKSWTRWENWTLRLSLTPPGLVRLAISRVPLAGARPLLARASALLLPP